MGWGQQDLIQNIRPQKLSTMARRIVVRGKMTCTVDMCVALDVQEENHSSPIDRKLIAQALQKRNLLRVEESIQISPNRRFYSIKFTTTHIISTFCTEPLTY